MVNSHLKDKLSKALSLCLDFSLEVRNTITGFSRLFSWEGVILQRLINVLNAGGRSTSVENLS